jgi:Acyl-[acyl carrier protein]--UDP-N-acetylglucosamine O-acyltransferase
MDNIILANNVQIGGHVTINKRAIVGGSCAIHQFCRIGEHAMIGGMTGVLSDVIPYGLSLGNRNILTGLNLIGLRRSGVSNQDIKIIQNAYDIIFSNSNFRKNIENLSLISKKNKYVNEITKFINSDKKRPISLPTNIS